MMINKGSNLSFTYHNTAKLVAKLLVDNNLDLSRVKAHHFFSGKNCPCTLRQNGLWTYFTQLIKYEYEILKLLNDVKIEFICNEDYVDKNGLIKNLPSNIKSINYKVIVSHENKSKELNFTSIIK